MSGMVLKWGDCHIQQFVETRRTVLPHMIYGWNTRTQVPALRVRKSPFALAISEYRDLRIRHTGLSREEIGTHQYSFDNGMVTERVMNGHDTRSERIDANITLSHTPSDLRRLMDLMQIPANLS